jgi:hypothetical protein
MLPDSPTPTYEMPAQRITWFIPPDRPVEGGTVFVRPESETQVVAEDSAPGGPAY